MELVINFSGGKDSSAMLFYLCEKYPDIKKHVIFADTGWEHPDAEDWARKIVSMAGLELNVCRNPNKTFLSMSEKRGKFPGMTTRQCTSDLKRGPIATWIRRNVKDKKIINCMGMRSSESTGRAKMKALVRNKLETNKVRTVWNYLPIHDWSDEKVFEYLKDKGVPLHPVYQHLRRFSCRICIYMTQHDINQVAKHDPEAINIISNIEEKIGFNFFQKGPIKTLIQQAV